MGEVLRRVQVYRLSTPEEVAVSAVGPAAAVPPASEPAELATMRFVILLGGVAVGMGMFAILWAWCYAEHRLWLESAPAPPAGDGIDQPLLAANEEQQECSCPTDALEAQQQQNGEAARAASQCAPTDSTSSFPSVDSTPSIAPAAAAASSSRKEEEEEVTAAVQPLRPPLRDFTIAELNTFDGGESPLSQKPHPIFISLRGTVYDASDGRGIYGPVRVEVVTTAWSCAYERFYCCCTNAYTTNFDSNVTCLKYMVCMTSTVFFCSTRRVTMLNINPVEPLHVYFKMEMVVVGGAASGVLFSTRSLFSEVSDFFVYRQSSWISLAALKPPGLLEAIMSQRHNRDYR